jgi:DNA-binding transcriptional LysR family regulator
VELRTLRSFVAVAEECNVTRAARRLNLAQPSLSQQIRRLERDIGVDLLDRSRRAIRLTPAGESFLVGARIVLEAADAAKQTARRVARGEVGQLVFGFAPASRHLVPAAVRAFRSRSPQIDVTLREVDPRLQREGLLTGRIHVGLLHDTVDTEGLATELVRRERFVLALAADHRLAGRRAIRLSDLRGEPFVVPGDPFGQSLPEPASFNRIVLAACAKIGFVPRVARRAPDLETRLVLVASGMGVSMVLESARPARTHGVVFRPLGGPPLALDLLVVWRPGDETPSVAAFREGLHIAARARENGSSSRHRSADREGDLSAGSVSPSYLSATTPR